LTAIPMTGSSALSSSLVSAAVATVRDLTVTNGG
jgi:hypothetical protein